MKLHYLQHVPFEGIGCISDWAKDKGITITSTQLFSGEELPSVDAFDFLVVMGGSMGVYDETSYTWMKAEKAFIEASIQAGRKVLGICLGAQLIADVLGSNVYANKQKEIGWFPVEIVDTSLFVLKGFEELEIVYQWHGDTFDLPEGTTLLATNEVCDNQAFLYKNHVLGLQFHLETTVESIGQLIDNCRGELKEEPYIQSEEGMLGAENHIQRANALMYMILNQFFVK